MLECRICYKEYKHLGSHIPQAHGILARDYKIQFGLNINHSLITLDIKNKKRKAVSNKPTYIKNLLQKGIKSRFRKGQKVRNYFSDEFIEKLRIQNKLRKINKHL